MANTEKIKILELRADYESDDVGLITIKLLTEIRDLLKK